MSTLPPISRLITEDFGDQKKWIARLLQPLNQFMESIYAALNRGLTIKENMSGDIIITEVDGTFPVKLAWSLKSKPIAVNVGDIQRSDGGTFSLSGAPGIRWSYNQNGQLQIDQVTGITPTPAQKFKLTLQCYTG